ncbi:putative Cytochrome P450 [Aspergillus mulundensis]|uniref:Putative Cytochrome P450 n=1 Tax=Aspergillus mulundensis TaxID=1810919 RepID=A0A3D8QVH7_9EURO|nr:putative Cytochrome P450 [Aspergillus mulundensis]RDW65769.1 putative Cytochrome P450 [Aspergillus mulundensis]
MALAPAVLQCLGDSPRTILTLVSIALLAYVVYMRHIHPLSRYPGPLFASLSNTYKAYYVYKLAIHEKLLELHNAYGPVVRIGPNHLHTWEGEAIAPIYKGGRSMGKSEFYDAFTAFRPNLFGGRDEDIHALRRRQLSHGFAQVSVQKLEPLIEGQMAILISKLRRHAQTGETFDLKHALNLYVLDILGEVAFAKPFGVQLTEDVEKLHAINDHLLLAGVIGELPCQDLTKFLSSISPVPWMRRLMKSRLKLKGICAGCVRFKIENQEKITRPDLLRSLVEATDPESGKRLSEEEINSEAFAVLVAGSHSTAGTMTLLFWHLIQNPSIMRKVQAEIESTLGPLAKDQTSYPIAGLEASLKYTMACVRENFRINPVFTMPLWRKVGYPAGLDIGEHHIPYGTNICISNYVLHHNPSIFGPDHAIYNPEKWLDESWNKEKGRYLIPFSVGHRMCIGRNLAMTNILKSVTTLLAMFEFEPLQEQKERSVRVLSPGIGEMAGCFEVRVRLRGEGGR